MKRELQEALRLDFPHVFGYKREEGKPFLPIVFGCECGDGWEPIIRRICEVLEPHGVEAHQIKEKFGGLRFYIGNAPKECHAAIEEGETESYKTCEDCGAPGNTRGGGWIRTLCDKCNDSRLSSD